MNGFLIKVEGRVILLENYSQPFLGPDLFTYGNNITLSLQLMMWVAGIFL